jgi:hypothetical protein
MPSEPKPLDPDHAERKAEAARATPLDFTAIIYATRELAGAIRDYAWDDESSREWWAVAVNCLWQVDRALNPMQLGYGDPRRDEPIRALPRQLSGPLCRVRKITDKGIVIFGITGMMGPKGMKGAASLKDARVPNTLEDVLKHAREKAEDEGYAAVPFDRRYADELDRAASELAAEPEAKEGLGGKRERATKKHTEWKTQAAIVYKATHPDAREKAVAEAVGIPRTTLSARPEWQEWLPRIEKAAASGKLSQLQSALDKRTGELVAYEDQDEE